MHERAADLTLLSTLAVVVGIGIATPAAADPPPPEVPADQAPPPTLRDAPLAGPLAQANDADPGIAGLPDLSAMGNQLLLGQTSTPALPGTEAGAVPIPHALNNSYLLPQNVVPSAPGEGEIVGVEPGEENADVTKREYLHRLYDSYRAGGLEGGLLGQRPLSELDQPVPPPPG